MFSGKVFALCFFVFFCCFSSFYIDVSPSDPFKNSKPQFENLKNWQPHNKSIWHICTPGKLTHGTWKSPHLKRTMSLPNLHAFVLYNLYICLSLSLYLLLSSPSSKTSPPQIISKCCIIFASKSGYNIQMSDFFLAKQHNHHPPIMFDECFLESRSQSVHHFQVKHSSSPTVGNCRIQPPASVNTFGVVSSWIHPGRHWWLGVVTSRVPQAFITGWVSRERW